MKDYKATADDRNSILNRIDNIFEEGYKQGWNDAVNAHDLMTEEQAEARIEKQYQTGFEDGWMQARKIVNDYADAFGKTREDIFGFSGYRDVLNHFTASEALQKIREYEQKQGTEEEIRVMDEVRFECEGKSYKGIVYSGPTKAGNYLCACPDGIIGYYDKTELTKTGKSYPQIRKLLEEMRE